LMNEPHWPTRPGSFYVALHDYIDRDNTGELHITTGSVGVRGIQSQTHTQLAQQSDLQHEGSV